MGKCFFCSVISFDRAGVKYPPPSGCCWVTQTALSDTVHSSGLIPKDSR